MIRSASRPANANRQMLADRGARLFPLASAAWIPGVPESAGSPVLREPADNSPQASQAPDRGDCRRANGPDNRADTPAELCIVMSDELMMTLRMAATAERVTIAEAVKRAISAYAEGLGLQVLVSAFDLDADLAREFRARPVGDRFRSGGP